MQLAVALAAGSSARATNRGIDRFLVAVLVIETIALTYVLVKRRTPIVPWMATVDIGVMCVLLIGQMWYAPVETRFSTWDAWGFGVTIASTVLAAVGFQRTSHTFIAIAAMTACYVASIGPSAAMVGHLMTVISNGLGYLINGSVGRFAWLYVLRLAQSADNYAKEERLRARARSREMATRQGDLEHALHDVAGQIKNIATRLESGDRRAVPDLEFVARQARHALTGQDRTEKRGSLTEVVAAVSRATPALHISCVLDEVDQVFLSPSEQNAVANAIRALLGNIATHADADKTVVHGAVNHQAWEITIHDDGRGFDTRSTAEGYGLGTQVRGGLDPFGIRAEVESTPGEGTMVTLRGPIGGGR